MKTYNIDEWARDTFNGLCEQFEKLRPTIYEMEKINDYNKGNTDIYINNSFSFNGEDYKRFIGRSKRKAKKD